MRMCTPAICFIACMVWTALPASPSRAEESPRTQIESAWNLAQQMVQEQNLERAEATVKMLEGLMMLSGFESLEDCSLKLLLLGEQRLTAGDLNGASRLLNMAERLSPRSPKVLVSSLPLVRGLSGSGAALMQLMRAGGLFWHRPELVLRLGMSLLYPALWALTLSLYASFALYFIYHIQDILRKSARLFPVSLRGYLTPLAILSVLVVPILFGPLWCLTAWAALFYLLVPGRRWIGLCTGVLLCLWAAVIPLRENLSDWLESEGIETMLRNSAGVFSKADLGRMEQLAAARPDDGVVHFVYAQLLKKLEELPEAEQQMEQAETLLGAQPYTVAERGVLAFLAGKDEEAEKILADAERQGLHTAELYLNMSKVKFERMELPASTAYYEKARALDPEMTRFYKTREEAIGVRNVRSCAEIKLPLRMLLLSLARNTYTAERRARDAAKALLPGFDPRSLAMLGGALIVLFFVVSSSRDTIRQRSYYHNYRHSTMILWLVRVVPGGSWIIGRRPALTFVSLALSLLLVMPVVQWPAESRYILDSLQEFYGAYVALTLTVMVTLSLVSYRFVETDPC